MLLKSGVGRFSPPSPDIPLQLNGKIVKSSAQHYKIGVFTFKLSYLRDNLISPLKQAWIRVMNLVFWILRRATNGASFLALSLRV